MLGVKHNCSNTKEKIMDKLAEWVGAVLGGIVLVVMMIVGLAMQIAQVAIGVFVIWFLYKLIFTGFGG
tara:strand:+ start:459 stop:662 length:204 start_codon:yes stop_codon:yes gene_type:complete